MIYCYKKLRELRLTHIFFLHYSISLIIGGAVIAGLFLFGGGLQIFAIVVLLHMYFQPAIIMLRRMNVYKIRSELQYGSYTCEEKLDIVSQSLFLKPIPDKVFFCNFIIILISCILFFVGNNYLIFLESINSNFFLVYFGVVITTASMLLAETGIIQRLIEDGG